MKLNKPMLAASLVTLTASIAIAELPPGYAWGIYNCGPNVTNSEAACLLCCRDGHIDGDIDAIELDGCMEQCEDAVFVREDFLGSFFRNYRPFWF